MATDVSIRVGVDGEAEFRSALNGINSQIRNLNSEMKSVVSGFTGMDNAEKKTAQQTEVLGRKMEATKQKISVLTAEYDRQKAKLNQLGNELDQLLNAQNRDEAAITKATNAYNRQQTVVNNLGRQINDATADMNRMEQEMDDLASGARETGNALDDAGDKASGFGSKISSGFTVLKGIAANVIASGIQTIASSLTSLAGEAVDAADSLTKFESTMSFAGFSTDEINSVSAAMQEYASRTVYDLQTVANTVAQLGANGVQDYEQLTEAAGNLNAVAGGNAETFRSVAMVLTQTAGAGKLTTENWNQLADAIPGASGLLQEAMRENGAYVGNFREAMENGEITADEFSQAIMQLGMTDTAQQAAESVETIEGAMGNLKATIVDTMAAILTDGGGMQMITGVINSITAGIQGLVAAFQEGGIQAVFSQITLSIQTFLTNLQANMPMFITAGMQMITGLIQGIIANLPVVITLALQFIQTFATGITTALPQLIPAATQAVTMLLQTLQSHLPEFLQRGVEILTNLANGIINAIPQLVGQLPQVISAIVSFIVSSLPQIIQSGIQLLVSFAQGIISAIPQLVGQLPQVTSAIVSTIASNLPQILQSGVSIIQSLIQGILSLLGSVASAIGQIASTILNKVRELPGQFLSIGSQIIQGLVNGIMSGLSSVVNAIGNVVSSAVNAAKSFLGIASPSKVFTEIGDYTAEGLAVGIRRGTSEAVDAADEMARAVTDASAIGAPQVGSSFEGAVEVMTEDEPMLFDYVASLFERLNAVISEYLTELLDMAHSTLTSYFNQFQQAGKYLMEGVAAGVRAGRSGVINAIEDALWAAVAAAKAAMEISSPSRVFEEIGKYMGRGNGVGFDAAMVPVNGDIARTMMQPINQVSADDIYNAAAGAVNGITAAGSASGTQTIIIPVNLNGKQIAEVIYDPLRQVGKQRGVAFG